MSTPDLLVPPPVLVAHRGYSGRYPENTLLAYQAAFEHGARYMELDLQLTEDRVPVLHHDQTLQRMAGVDLDVRDIKASIFKSLPAGYKERFGDDFIDNKFTTFKKYCRWLAENPEVTTFVEIKQESIDRVGVPVFVDEVCKRISQTRTESQCVIISFNTEVVEYTRKVSALRVGWVLPEWGEQHRATLRAMRPDFLFSDKALLPEDEQSIWRGDWQWAIYNLDSVESAIAMANRGFRFLETNQIGLLMADPQLGDRESRLT